MSTPLRALLAGLLLSTAVCARGATAALTTKAPLSTVTPAALPDPQIPGFKYPESEATILGWVYDLENGSPALAAAAFEKINLHGWGLWSAVTMETNQVQNGQKLRVFETWSTPQELAGQPDTGFAPVSNAVRLRAPLRPFSQFRHTNMANIPTSAHGGGLDQVIGFIKYDPTAADHILKEQLLSTSALMQLKQGGAQQIPVFPSTALAIKAAFQVISAKHLVSGRYYALKVWGGPPTPAQSWDSSKWFGSVWIDLQGGGLGLGAIDYSMQTDGAGRTNATTYPISQLINYRISAADAAALNQEQPGAGAAAGDYAILVGMHIAGREIARWTWQTFWWTPTPNTPSLPSSGNIAMLRPPQLQGAARHYAMALGYDMVTPGQPTVRGANAGLAIYVYNPWLEAHFGPADLPDSVPGFDPSGQPAGNNYGVTSNCMSCHARANYNPDKLVTAPRYSGARYVDLADPQFAGTLQLDFLWSLPNNAQ